MRIVIRAIGETMFEVTVNDRGLTRHTVSLDVNFYKKLTNGSVPPAELVRRSFEFLLEREPNTSILSSFDLSVIGRFFPEYESEMGKMLRP